VTALLVHNGFLYSVSYDGSVKMWDADSMELVMEAKGAHEGSRVNCAAIGADGNLYTGGDDKVCPDTNHAQCLSRGTAAWIRI
jgi:pleiotropic regulator 1